MLSLPILSVGKERAALLQKLNHQLRNVSSVLEKIRFNVNCR